jgi:hypothetical protein
VEGRVFLCGVAGQAGDELRLIWYGGRPSVHRRREDMRLAKGNEPPPPFVPKNHAQALEALERRKSPDGSKLWVIP